MMDTISVTETGSAVYSGPRKEAVLKLWQHRYSAVTIMSVLNLSEDELDEIVPRSLWFHDGWTECKYCGGRGGKSFTFQRAGAPS